MTWTESIFGSMVHGMSTHHAIGHVGTLCSPTKTVQGHGPLAQWSLVRIHPTSSIASRYLHRRYIHSPEHHHYAHASHQRGDALCGRSGGVQVKELEPSFRSAPNKEEIEWCRTYEGPSKTAPPAGYSTGRGPASTPNRRVGSVRSHTNIELRMG